SARGGPTTRTRENGGEMVAVSEVEAGVLSQEELEKIDKYWRAANFLSVGQIYLLDNPLLREPLSLEHVKPRLLGHWGTTPGLNFIYVHLNRVIKAHDLNMIYICGPGDGRSSPADPASERLQDRQSDRARADAQGGAGQPPRRLRLQAVFRRRQRSRAGASRHGGDARSDHRRDRRDQARRARERQPRSPAVADAGPAHAEGVDGPEGDRGQEGRGLLALAPGPVLR